MHVLLEEYIKKDKTKHIFLKFFYTYDLKKNDDISIQQTRSCDNLVDIFTNSFPNRTFEQMEKMISLRPLRDDRVVREKK